MPIYEYRCNICGSVSEYLIGIGGDGHVLCKTCGSKELERILSAASISVGSSGRTPGHTCCGREERCEKPPCAGGDSCRRK